MNCAKEDDLHRNVKSEYPSQNQQVFRIELSKDNNSVLKNIQSENIPVHVLKNNSLPIFEFLINELKEKLSK